MAHSLWVNEITVAHHIHSTEFPFMYHSNVIAVIHQKQKWQSPAITYRCVCVCVDEADQCNRDQHKSDRADW